MAAWKEMHGLVTVCLVKLVILTIVDSVKFPSSGAQTQYTAANFGQTVTLVCDMRGRVNRYPVMWFYVDSENYISRNEMLFPTLDEDRLNRYSAWVEPDFNQYMLRIDNSLIRDGGKYVCGYNDRVINHFVPLWDTTLVVFQPPEDNTLACDVTYLHSEPRATDRFIEVSCSWNIELLNVDVSMSRGRTSLPPDLTTNGRMISRLKVGRFTRLNNFRCVMIYPDQNRQSAMCTLPQQEPRPVVHILPLVQTTSAGNSIEFACNAQNQRRSNLIWTPNCAESRSLDICKRITFVNGGSRLRITNPQLGDDGMLIQCSVLTRNGRMAAGAAQLRVESARATAGDAGMRGGRGRGTEVGWTNQNDRNGIIPVTALEAIPITPTLPSHPGIEAAKSSPYFTIIPIIVVILLLLILGYMCLSKLKAIKRKRQAETHFDNDYMGRHESIPEIVVTRVSDAVRAIPEFFQKARTPKPARGKTGAQHSLAVSSAWSSRGSVPRSISPISITPDIYNPSPLMSTSVPRLPPPKPPPKVIVTEEAPYQNTMFALQTEMPRIDPKLVLVRPSKRLEFIRISNDITRGYTNLRPDAVLPKKCSITEDDYGYLVRSAKKNRFY